MSRRSTIRWSLVAMLAGALVGVMTGVVISRYQVRLLRAKITHLEESRTRLRKNSDALAAALREARAPLARRIHELETTLAAREVAPPPEKPGEVMAVVATAEPAPTGVATETASGAPQAPEPLTPEPATPPEAPAPNATTPKERSARPVARLTAPSPLPAVSAAPPPADNPCPSLEAPNFTLASPDAEVQRFGGRLVLSVESSTQDLVVRLGDDTRYRLVGLPLHVATKCGGQPYIVSICVAERNPFEVRGVITPADAWHKPCRAFLGARVDARR